MSSMYIQIHTLSYVITMGKKREKRQTAGQLKMNRRTNNKDKKGTRMRSLQIDMK